MSPIRKNQPRKRWLVAKRDRNWKGSRRGDCDSLGRKGKETRWGRDLGKRRSLAACHGIIGDDGRSLRPKSTLLLLQKIATTTRHQAGRRVTWGRHVGPRDPPGSQVLSLSFFLCLSLFDVEMLLKTTLWIAIHVALESRDGIETTFFFLNRDGTLIVRP